MELMMVLRVLLRRWWAIVVPVVIVALVAVPDLLRVVTADASTTYATSFRYSAAQAFNLPQREGDYQDVWLASEFVVNAFTEWLRSSSFRDELGRALPAVDLGPLGIATDNDRSIGLVQMSHPDADALAQIAAASLEIVRTRNHMYFPHLGGEPADVTIIDAPVVQPVNAALPSLFTPLLQLALALLAGLGLAFLIEYLDPTLHGIQDVESQGVRVLAAVPKQRA